MAQAAATQSVRTIRRDVPFAWEGRDKRGTRIKGRSLAPDEATLRVELRRQGIAPSRIRKQSASMKGGKVKPEDIAVFARQLATMLAAGIPMVQAFEIVGSAVDISDQAAKEGVWDLRRSGLEKVKSGMTSLEEVNSVTTE